MMNLMKSAGLVDKDVSRIVNDVVENCDICLKHKKTPPKPVVSIPLSSKFNDVVALDLKKWNDGQILHVIDLFSRFTRAKFKRD